MKSEHTIKNKIREYRGRYEKGEVSEEVYNEIQTVLQWIVVKEPMDIPFEDIWAIYAKKDFSGQRGPRFNEKKKAREHWGRMSASGRAYAIKYAKKFISNKPFETYQPPALIRYLKNERWEEVMDDNLETTQAQPESMNLMERQREVWGDRG